MSDMNEGTGGPSALSGGWGLVATLRKQANEIAIANHKGCGNTMTDAADEIERLRAALTKIAWGNVAHHHVSIAEKALARPNVKSTGVPPTDATKEQSDE